MPLTASGKLDRGQLKILLDALEGNQLSRYALLDASAPPARPLTDLESRLRDLWVSVLGANSAAAAEVGPASHFFRLGGDSVTAMRLVAMATKVTPPVHLSIADVFANPV